ncbi:GNAT family N-acetyltransferase [Butyrivibrio sp. VCD2006]|uniref:GNAT family N-acetyltransferase n=1 Tax=Butyrivibrio sp. VCD2006 TaxID=1280664 RepID=UPI0004196DEF|nr:GNAT family N-acetyltransferase [Butyrivibrio sp. VCD2006]
MGNIKISDKFEFRTIKFEEAVEAAVVESICFPPNEACSEKNMIARVKAAGDFFLVAINKETGKIAGFLNGIASDEQVLRDDFFTDANNHNPNGENVMIAGLAVLPEFRGTGLARTLVEHYRERETRRGRKRLVLTCLDEKVGMYQHFGFRDLGESESVWGGEKWHEMDMVL